MNNLVLITYFHYLSADQKEVLKQQEYSDTVEAAMRNDLHGQPTSDGMPLNHFLHSKGGCS